MAKKKVILTDIDMIKSLAERAIPGHDGTWLDHLTYSEAFITCIAQGPWNEKRRIVVCTKAMDEYYGCGDLRFFTPSLKMFPLEWQNNTIISITNSLRCQERRFDVMCEAWIDSPEHWKVYFTKLFRWCGVTKAGTKTLWLFVRDKLKLPAFPIDRHVKRWLKGLSLPCDSWEMTKLCVEAGVDPAPIARAMFNGTFKDAT